MKPVTLPTQSFRKGSLSTRHCWAVLSIQELEQGAKSLPVGTLILVREMETDNEHIQRQAEASNRKKDKTECKGKDWGGLF